MNGRHLSFADIVRMYQQPLYWYIRRVTIVHEDAEDILQETFMKAYKHLWQLRDPGALKPWLMRIATNELNRYFKGARSCRLWKNFRIIRGLSSRNHPGRMCRRPLPG